MPTIEFGKHKGSNIMDVPSGYLEWMVENTKGVSLQMAQDELKRRSGDHNISSKLSRSEWMGKLVELVEKMPDGLLDQTVKYKNFEIKVRVVKDA